MPDQETLSRLKDGVETWNAWRHSSEISHIDLSRADLNEAHLVEANLNKANLSGANLSKAKLIGAKLIEANLSKAKLIEARLSGADLSGADLSGADLSGADLSEATLSYATLSGANLSGADLSRANLSGFNLSGVNFSGANLSRADLSGADLSRADLSGADLSEANLSKAILFGPNLSGANLSRVNLSGFNLSGADLSKADLSGADLSEANLSKANLSGANLDKTKFYFSEMHKTKLWNIQFSPQHPVFYDGSDTIKLSLRDRYLNWAIIRAIGKFPLFGISWTALAITLSVINIIVLFNESEFRSSIIGYPILIIPDRMALLLTSTLLLVVGSTLYKFICPTTVQEFSESEWVVLHHHPRLLYLAEKLNLRLLQWPTLVFSVAGAIMALYLIGEQIWTALKHIAFCSN